MLGWPATLAPKPQAGVLALDHLVYEVESLASACDVFEQITGVRPLPGSRHEVLGVHNAIVGLGSGRYLEFLAKSPAEVLNRGFGIGWGGSSTTPVSVLGVEAEKPRLTTWCCDTRHVGISGLVAELSRSPLRNLFPAEVVLISRPAGDGRRTTWRVAADRHRECSGGSLPMGGLVPFLIDWPDDPPHRPGLAAPPGCELIELKGVHPEPDDVGAVLRSMRADHLIAIERGSEPRMSAVIKHPRGQLVLE